MGLEKNARAVNNAHLDFGDDSMSLANMPKYKYVCIGYNAEFMEDSEPNMGVYDILLTVGKPYQEDGFEKDGCEYYPVSDTSLNAGTDGDDIYMYITYDPSDLAESPITNLALSRGDSTPPGIGASRYEYILTDTGEKANLNRGATAKEGAVLLDTRLRLFAHRYDNTVKSGALFDLTDYETKTIRYDVAVGNE